MPKRPNHTPPTDEEILSQNNVPVEIAAKYIGWSTATIYYALQEERAPFGFAAQNPEKGTWTYNISPGLLIAYKRGTLPTYKLDEVQKLAVDGIERILSEKLSAMGKIIGIFGDSIAVKN